MSITTLDGLFLHTLKDVLYAERKFLKALPRMERKARDPGLNAALSSHREQTEEHVIRLEEVFETLGRPARGSKCGAMVGLIDEAEGLMALIDEPETMDAALVSLAQAIAQYEIARYGTLVAWARQLGKPDVATLLKATLDEECATARSLSNMAEGRLIAIAAARTRPDARQQCRA